MQFTLEPFMNSYLPAGANRVDAILTVTATGTGVMADKPQAVVGLIIDISGSMQGQRIEAAKHATRKAIELIDPSAQFFVIAFSNHVWRVAAPALATPQNKALAQAAVQRLEAGGGTVISQAMRQARTEFQQIARRPALRAFPDGRQKRRRR